MCGLGMIHPAGRTVKYIFQHASVDAVDFSYNGISTGDCVNGLLSYVFYS